MDYLQRETECTCGDPECADCHPIAPLSQRMRRIVTLNPEAWLDDIITTDWIDEVEEMERDQHELLETIEYIHGGRSERYARSQRIKLLIKHGRIKVEA